jgi:lipoprotein-releasing system ATP-binding protein
MFIRAIDIEKSYGSLNVLKGVSMEVKKGEIIAITGASGAGKSTLLHILGTLDRPDSGKVLFENREVSALKDRELSSFRNREIGFVFQFHHLFPEFTALENVCIPAFIHGKSKKEAQARALELLKIMELEGRKGHKPAALSGGEQQRVAVARALVNNPGVVCADEPSGNLDSKASFNLHQLFIKLRNELNQSFIIVTHNRELAALSDRILHIKDGIIQDNDS